jgi:N-methylhydantoinase B
MTITTEPTAPVIPPVQPDGYWDGVQRSYIPPVELALPENLKLHEAVADEVDPVTYEVIRYALMNANFEHSALLQRLCISPITMLTRDFQTSLLTELGDLVFLGPNLQYFSSSQSLSAKFILENRVGDLGLAPGDVFVTNDVYVGAPHQPDTALVAPIFVGDELFGWVANTLHYSDVGGSTPGSFCLDALDCFQEPLNWPPVKLVEDGEVRTDIYELFARQSRLPAAVKMDLRAAIGGVESTRAKIDGLIGRYGAGAVKYVMRGMMDGAEELFVSRLQGIPDGTWSHRGFTEASVPGDREVYAYQINIHKRGDRLIVDNRGTDSQAGAINVTYAALSGAVLCAITQSMTSDLTGAYGGVYRRIEFRPESGLLNCCDHPGAVSPSGALTTEMQLYVAVMAVAKMLASGDERQRGLILGPNIPHFYCTIAGGLKLDGNPWIHPNTNGMMGSLGGMPDRDGVDSGGHYWIPEGVASNVEDLEAEFPLLLISRKLLDGCADGAGRHLGGIGFSETTMTLDSGPGEMAVAPSDSFPKGIGLFGGNPGTRAPLHVRTDTNLLELLGESKIPVSVVDDVEGDLMAVEPKVIPFALNPGDVWEWSSPTTGGYGDPLQREPGAVLRDAEANLLSAADADRIYGVVLVDGAVEQKATVDRRRAIRAERLGKEPGEPVERPTGARQVGELLHVVEGRWWCNGADLGPVEANYKLAAATREISFAELSADFGPPTYGEDIAAKVVYREFLCPVTGLRIDTEMARIGEPPLHDIVLG